LWFHFAESNLKWLLTFSWLLHNNTKNFFHFIELDCALCSFFFSTILFVFDICIYTNSLVENFRQGTCYAYFLIIFYTFYHSVHKLCLISKAMQKVRDQVTFQHYIELWYCSFDFCSIFSGYIYVEFLDHLLRLRSG
jgi:hypothetical protein